MIRLALSLLTLATPAAADISLSIPFGPDAQVISAQFSCDGGEPFPVQYINAQPNNLALLPIDGQQRIFVNVISGSGARYVSGQYEWWTKGDQATLRDAMAEGGTDGDGQSCTATDPGATQ